MIGSGITSPLRLDPRLTNRRYPFAKHLILAPPGNKPGGSILAAKVAQFLTAVESPQRQFWCCAVLDLAPKVARDVEDWRGQFASRGTRVWPRTGPRLIARGASPWYAGAITLEYNAALKRAEVPVRGRQRLVREGLALFAVPGAREPLAINRDPIRGRGVGGRSCCVRRGSRGNEPLAIDHGPVRGRVQNSATPKRASNGRISGRMTSQGGTLAGASCWYPRAPTRQLDAEMMMQARSHAAHAKRINRS
jgi:hypothetical protein